MSDEPQFSGDYIVGWKLRVILRLEEYSNTQIVRNLASNPITPPQSMRGVTSTRSQLTYTQTANGYAVNFAGGTATQQGGPQAANSSPDLLTYCIGAVIPNSFKYSLNGFKQPDTMTCELRYVDIPFDPLCFRSVGVELYVGCYDQDAYTQAMEGAVQTVTPSAGASQSQTPLNVIPDGFTGPLGEQRTNLRFQGFVDEWEVTFNDQGLAVVNFMCSDNTRLLIDQAMPPGLRLDTTKPVDLAVAQLLAQFPQFAGLTVQYRPAQVTVPVLGSAFSQGAQVTGGLPASQGGASQTLSVWDYLVEAANSFGHNIRVEGTNVVIQRIRAAVGKNSPPRYDDPFQGRTWGGQEHLLRTFVWGRNCKVVGRKRNYARTDVNVEVRAFSPEAKTTLIARYPPFANAQGLGGQASGPNASTNRIVHALPGDGKQETKYTVFPVPGVVDQATLNNISQAYYEGLNRGMLNLTVKTKDLASYAGSAVDPDVLDMLAGDRFEFLAERFDDSTPDYPASSLAVIENDMLQANPGDLLAGFDPDFVMKYLATYKLAAYQTTFVVHHVDVSGDLKEGIEIDVEGRNMVEARLDAPGVADGSDAALGAQGTAAPATQNQPSGFI
jgi:hypothetical protein